MPRRWRSSTEAVNKPSGRGTLAEASVPRLTSRLKSPVSPLIDGLILAGRRLPIDNVCGAPRRSRPQLAPSEAAEDAGYPESQNGAEAVRDDRISGMLPQCQTTAATGAEAVLAESQPEWRASLGWRIAGDGIMRCRC